MLQRIYLACDTDATYSSGQERSGSQVIRVTSSHGVGLNNDGLMWNTVVAADGLSKRDVFKLPDPFAVITVDAEQTHTTSVMKKTLNPYWNENFDV